MKKFTGEINAKLIRMLDRHKVDWKYSNLDFIDDLEKLMNNLAIFEKEPSELSFNKEGFAVKAGKAYQIKEVLERPEDETEEINYWERRKHLAENEAYWNDIKRKIREMDNIMRRMLD